MHTIGWCISEDALGAGCSVQVEILNLLVRLRRERRLTTLMASHDLAVIAHSVAWIKRNGLGMRRRSGGPWIARRSMGPLRASQMTLMFARAVQAATV